MQELKVKIGGKNLRALVISKGNYALQKFFKEDKVDQTFRRNCICMPVNSKEPKEKDSRALKKQGTIYQPF